MQAQLEDEGRAERHCGAGSRRAAPTSQAWVTIAVASGSYRVDATQLLAPNRCQAGIASARQVAMYVAHVTLGLSMTEVGRCFGRDRTTAGHACRLVEDLRDDDRFDYALAHMEAAALKLAHFSREP